MLACIRVPKSGSRSLSRFVRDALPDQTRFYLPDTLRRETRISGWQAFRLKRSQAQNLSKHWRVLSLDAALAKINDINPADGLLVGGHFDLPTVQAGLNQPVQGIVLLRDPADRARSDYNYARQGFLKKRPWQRFDAHLTAQAAGRYDFEGFLDYQLEHPEVFADLASAYVGWRDDQALETVLPSIFCWGVLEESDAFAARMSEMTGRPLTFGRSNATDLVEVLHITATERRKIERLYARDLELYARCRDDYSVRASAPIARTG